MVRPRNPNPRSNQVIYEADIQWLKSQYKNTVAESISETIKEVKRLRSQVIPTKLGSNTNPSYEGLVKEARLLKVGHENQAVRFIPRAYRMLLDQRLNPEAAQEKIRKDFKGCWEPSTFIKLLPKNEKTDVD